MSFRNPRTGAASLGMPLMILAFVTMAGFLYWLSLTTESEAVEVVEEAGDDMGGSVVTMDLFAADPTSYAGREIRLESISVASLVGGQAFWTQLPNETPYLIKMGPGALASGPVTAGDLTTVVGSVVMMSDSVLDAWEAAGAFSDESQRFEAEFAENFVEAAALEVLESSQPSS